MDNKITIDLSDIPMGLDTRSEILEWVNKLLLAKIPRWATEDYQGSERDFTAWLREVAEKTRFQDTIALAKGSKPALARAKAELEFWVSTRTRKAKDVADRAFILQLYEMNQNGWYHHLPGELDTLEEYLSLFFDEMTEGTTVWYDYKFLIETALPILKQVGATPEDIIGLSHATSKARAAVPAMRHIVKAYADDDGIVAPEAAEQVLGIARQVSDPDISVASFRTDMQQVTGKIIGTKALVPIPVQKFIMPGGETWLLFKAPSNAYVRAAEIGLKGVSGDRVDVRDPKSFVVEAAALLRKRIVVDDDLNIIPIPISGIDKFLNQPIHS
jgi:hypothetical protein